MSFNPLHPCAMMHLLPLLALKQIRIYCTWIMWFSEIVFYHSKRKALAEEQTLNRNIFYSGFYERAIHFNSIQTVVRDLNQTFSRREREREMYLLPQEWTSTAPALEWIPLSSPPLRYYFHLNIWKFMQMKISTNCSSLAVHECPCPRHYTIGYM